MSRLVEEFEPIAEEVTPRFVHVTEVSANAIYPGGDSSKYIVAVDEAGNLHLWLKNDRIFKKLEKPNVG